MSTIVTSCKVSDLVKSLEEETTQTSRELGEMKATLIVNWGSETRNGQPNPNPVLLKDHSASGLSMLITVVEHYQRSVSQMKAALSLIPVMLTSDRSDAIQEAIKIAKNSLEYLERKGVSALQQESPWIPVTQRNPGVYDTSGAVHHEVLTLQTGRSRPTFMKWWEVKNCPFTTHWMPVPVAADSEPVNNLKQIQMATNSELKDALMPVLAAFIEKLATTEDSILQAIYAFQDRYEDCPMGPLTYQDYILSELLPGNKVQLELKYKDVDGREVSITHELQLNPDLMSPKTETDGNTPE